MWTSFFNWIVRENIVSNYFLRQIFVSYKKTVWGGVTGGMAGAQGCFEKLNRCISDGILAWKQIFFWYFFSEKLLFQKTADCFFRVFLGDTGVWGSKIGVTPPYICVEIVSAWRTAHFEKFLGIYGGGGTVNIFDFFDRISDLDEKCLYSAKNVYTSKDLKKISPSLKNVYILWKMFTLVNIFLKM